jgi:hypothetical protein
VCGGAIGRPIHEINVVFPRPNEVLRLLKAGEACRRDFASWWGVGRLGRRRGSPSLQAAGTYPPFGFRMLGCASLRSRLK